MNNKDYVLGTHEEELKRLELQNSIWKPYVLKSWNDAGITIGSRVLDIGSGPGYASFDLRDIVGETGTIHSFERSDIFINHIDRTKEIRGIKNIHPIELDLITDVFPKVDVDFIWCRWVATFVSDPKLLIFKLSNILKKGGKAIFFEYANYESFTIFPPMESQLIFRNEVMKSWRMNQGEPNIALDLPKYLSEINFKIIKTKPHVFCIKPTDFMWNWVASFIEIGTQRLISLGLITEEFGLNFIKDFKEAESKPYTYVLTPLVLEIIAEKI